MAFTNFAMPFMFAGVGVALPAIGREMAMSGAALGLFETLYLGTATALMLPAGRISDAGDKNSLFTLGVALFTATTLALAVLPSVPLLLTFRVLQGVCVALVAATNMAILTENVPRERLGRAMGLNIGAVYVGLAAGTLRRRGDHHRPGLALGVRHQRPAVADRHRPGRHRAAAPLAAAAAAVRLAGRADQRGGPRAADRRQRHGGRVVPGLVAGGRRRGAAGRLRSHREDGVVAPALPDAPWPDDRCSCGP